MNNNVRELQNGEFSELIASSKLPVLVDFWASWCAPCRMQTPIINDLADELLGKAVIAKVNIDENEDLAAKYGVSSIPTLMVFKGGEQVEKTVGLTSKSNLSALLIKYI